MHADDHADSGQAVFLSRLELDLACFLIPVTDFERYCNPLAVQYKIKYHLPLTDHRPKLAILVSAYDHCLADLPYRHGTVELGCDIVTIISDHDKAKPPAGRLLWDSHLLPSPHDKRKCEQQIMDWIGHDIDPIVPARYMQILRPEFVGHYLLRTINVHHCFLPVFVGAKPYHQATIFATQCPTAGNLLKKRNASRFSIFKTGFGSR